MLDTMSDSIDTLSSFSDMLAKADNKLGSDVGTENGFRSSFCSRVPADPSEIFCSRQKLQGIVSS